MEETHPACSNGIVAQLVEQGTENPCVAGSIPAYPTKLYGVSNR